MSGKVELLITAVVVATVVAIFAVAAYAGDDGRRIPGAKSLSSDATAEEVAKIAGKDKNALIVTYCANLKCPASRKLVRYLKKLKYTNVIEYQEGIEGWASAGHKVDKVTKSK